MENLQKAKKQQISLLLQKRTLMAQQFVYHYKPSPKQLSFHTLGALYKERLFLAGNRCGKTWCGAMEMAMHLTGEYPDWWQGLRFNKPIRAWAASVTAESTRDILQAAYLGTNNKIGAISANYIFRKTMRRGVSDAVDTVYIKHKSGGVSQLGFKSYDQGREKFQGTSRHFIHLDEEPDIRIYEECLLRTLDVGGNMVLTMTPLKGLSDVCEHYLANKTDDKTYVQASWEDAPHLGKQEIVRLRASLRPHEIEAREKGIPSLGSGRIFPVKEEEILVERFPVPSNFKQVFGLDFGWTNPTAITWGAYDDVQDIFYITDIYAMAEKSPQEHAQVILNKGKWIPGVCDPAGQSASQADGESLIQRYADHGVYLNKADNNVESGLMTLLELMREGKLKVFNDLEPWLKEFRVYRRDENGKVVKRNDHLMDATRYMVMSGLPLARTKPNTSTQLRRKQDWNTV